MQEFLVIELPLLYLSAYSRYHGKSATISGCRCLRKFFFDVNITFALCKNYFFRIVAKHL